MRYEAPATIEQAAALLAAEPGDARILAGGTDLLVQLRGGQIEPDLLVDIKKIPATRKISRNDDGWRIGAAVSCAEMGEHPGLCAAWPGVVEAAELIGSTQIQGRCTVAGNLCNSGPAADSVPAMIAAGATVCIIGPNGARQIPVEAFNLGPGKNVLKKGEIVEAILLPPKQAGSADAYLRFIPRTEMDIAVVGVGVNLQLGDDGICNAARVALGAVAPTALLVEDAAAALIGTRIDDDALETLGAAASAACAPIDDKRGTIEFRKDIAAVLARRTAKIALARARGDK